MSKDKQARIILEELNEQYTIPAYMEKFVLKGIIAGLNRIKQEGAEHGTDEHS